MGYCTYYTLAEVRPADKLSDVESTIKRITDYGDIFDDRVEWYDHERDVIAAMIETGVEFVLLHGEGEENGDVWDKEFTRTGNDVTCKEFRFQLVRDTEPVR